MQKCFWKYKKFDYISSQYQDITPVSTGRDFPLAAALALVHRYQPALLYIKLPLVEDLPFMEAVLAQRFSLVLFRELLLFEFQNSGHAYILQYPAMSAALSTCTKKPRQCGAFLCAWDLRLCRSVLQAWKAFRQMFSYINRIHCRQVFCQFKTNKFMCLGA